MRLKITGVGKIVKYKGIRLIVVKAVDKCRGCFFKRFSSCHPDIVGSCAPPWRDFAIIFRKYDENKSVNYHTKISRNGKN